MTQNEKFDFGSVQIHKKVLAEIVFNALKDIKGISLKSQTFTEKLFNVFSKQNFQGIEVKVDENQDVSFEIKVFVLFGMNIPDIAKHIQDIVKAALDKTVDINIKNINVNILGIERGQK